MRQFLRRHVPAPIRLQFAAVRRCLADASSGDSFASTRDGIGGYPHALPAYVLPIRDYAGQAHLAATKRRNLRLLAESLDGTVVQPGEVWSLWRIAGRPTRARGYGEAAAIIDGELTTAIGGSTCLLSTVVFNAGLLAGLEVVERSQHSVDTYGDRRYFELGRDATIEYGYLDLRFRNVHRYPIRLGVSAVADEVRAGFQAPVEPRFAVELAVEVARPSSEVLVAATRRLIREETGQTQIWTAESRYRTTLVSEFRERLGLPITVTA
jgi:vancomycin resistance protein YoaR